MSPKLRIAGYSSDEWEEFILEWAYGLAEEYASIKRLGGANDKGADVAAFKTDQGFEGPWDCFQGKHYAGPLHFNSVAPEILKIILGELSGHYVRPDSYQLLAPNGCGTTLNRLLSQPTKLKEKFLGELQEGTTLTSDLTADQVEQVRTLANTVDFAMFRSVELNVALETHRKTPWHSARFPSPLALRTAGDGPPDEVAPDEARYVEQLVAVYAERHPAEEFNKEELSKHPIVGTHFQRQRERFYKAESLRVYARDSVPPGTFDKLQDEIHSGVVDTAEAIHPSGFERLNAVMELVGALDLSRHTLISVTEIDDRKGICHQLANGDLLTWLPA